MTGRHDGNVLDFGDLSSPLSLLEKLSLGDDRRSDDVSGRFGFDVDFVLDFDFVFSFLSGSKRRFWFLLSVCILR
jgi:hypothetical protein